MQSTFYYLHALSALHAGTGQGTGVIDLPIVRERATHLPYVPGSSVKGVLREELYPETEGDGLSRQEWTALFGPELIRSDSDSFAGAVTLGDAHLLCLPIRSLAGTFAWAGCPFVLRRYSREAGALGIQPPGLTVMPSGEEAAVADDNVLTHDGKVVLEDLDLEANPAAGAWAAHIAEAFFPHQQEWQDDFKKRFAILPDDVFDFLAETATDVRARVRIDHNTRVVERGALWYEENLPAETLLYGLAACDRSRTTGHSADARTMLGLVPQGPLTLQLGGKATVGRGLVQWMLRRAAG